MDSMLSDLPVVHTMAFRNQNGICQRSLMVSNATREGILSRMNLGFWETVYLPLPVANILPSVRSK